MAHLAPAVRDEERSRGFYEKYFGFDASPPERMADGVLMFSNAEDFSLALTQTDEEFRLPGFHFAFKGASSPEDVRAIRERLHRDGVPIVEEWEEPDYISVKCRDPAQYRIELIERA